MTQRPRWKERQTPRDRDLRDSLASLANIPFLACDSAAFTRWNRNGDGDELPLGIIPNLLISNHRLLSMGASRWRPVLGDEEEDVRFRDATPMFSSYHSSARRLCKNILPIREAQTRCYDSEDKIGGWSLAM